MNPHALEALQRERAHAGAALPDAAGEDQDVQPAHRREVGADVFAHAVAEGLQRHQRPVVAGFGGLLDFAHVAGNARKPEQAAPLVEQFIDLAARQALLALQVGHHARIEVAAARAHDQPFAGREAHGRVHRAAVVHRAERGAVAEMATDDFQFVHPPLQVLRGAQRQT